MEKVCVIGLGYIGLPTAAIIANNDHRVLKSLKKFRIYQTQSVKKKPK